MDSENSLDEFVKYWARQGKFDQQGEVIIFRAIVTYFAKKKEKTTKAVTHLYFEGHRIEVIPIDWLTTEKFYTGFNPKYQRYSLEAGHVLRIYGSGPKVGGAYWVCILPE